MVNGAGTSPGGVQRQAFELNLKAQREKKTADGGHALHKLLQTADGSSVKSEGAHWSQPLIQPGGFRQDGECSEGNDAREACPRGRTGRGETDQPCSSVCGSKAREGAAQAEDIRDEMDVDGGWRTPAQDNVEWLVSPDAPLALPFRPSLTGSHGGSRWPPRPSLNLDKTDPSKNTDRQIFPPTSAAAALLHSDEDPRSNELLCPGEQKMLFVQLPMQLPISAGVRPGEPKPPMLTSTQYLTALSSGIAVEQADQERVLSAHNTAVNGSAAPKLASLKTLEDGKIGELIVHKSGKLVLQVGEFELDVRTGNECSFDQELTVLGPADKPGNSVDINQLGKLHRRIVVTPDVETLLPPLKIYGSADVVQRAARAQY